MIELRPYQVDAIAEIERERRPLLVSPTGSGKTVIASEVIRRAEDRHVLFLVHRREIVKQTKRHLAEFGIEAGLILAGEPDQMKAVQVGSIQTFLSRYMRGNRDLPHADVVFIDEAHHARARTYREIVENYPDAQVIGMTATPCRRDGRGLGGTFTTLVESAAPSPSLEIRSGCSSRSRGLTSAVDTAGPQARPAGGPPALPP